MANTLSTDLTNFNDAVKGLGQKTVLYDYLALQNPTVQVAIEKVQQALSNGKDPNTDSATKSYLKQIPTGLIQDLYQTVSLNPYDKSSANNLPKDPTNKDVLSKVFGSNTNYGNYVYNVFGPAAQQLSLSATKYQPKDANALYKPFQKAVASVYSGDAPDYSGLSSFLGTNATDRPLSGIQPNASSNPGLNTVYNERLQTLAKGGTGYDPNAAYGTGYSDNLVRTYDAAAAQAIKDAAFQSQYDWMPLGTQVVKALEPGQFLGGGDLPPGPDGIPRNSQGLEWLGNALRMTVNGPNVTWTTYRNVPTPLEVLYPTYQYTPSYEIKLNGNGVFGKNGDVLKPAPPSQTFVDQINADLKSSAQALADTFNQLYGGNSIGGVSTTTKGTTLNFNSSGGAPATYNNATLISKTDPAPIAIYTITPDAKVINNNPFLSNVTDQTIADTVAKNTADQTASQKTINDIKTSTADLTSQLAAVNAKTDPASVANAAELDLWNKQLAEAKSAVDATTLAGQSTLSDLEKTKDLSGAQAVADANKAAADKIKAENDAKLASQQAMVNAANQVTANQQASYAQANAALGQQQASSQLAKQALSSQQTLRGQADVAARQRYGLTSDQPGQAATAGAAGAAGAQAALAKTYGSPSTGSPSAPAAPQSPRPYSPLNKKSFYSGIPNPVGTFGLPASAAGLTFGGS